jgi:drug/metabolite transporter (DMT)-like permease
MWLALAVATLGVSPPQRTVLHKPVSPKTIAYRAEVAKSFQVWASLAINPQLECDQPCHIVQDSSTADAVVWNFRWVDLRTPPVKPPGQKWLLTSYIESPQTMQNPKALQMKQTWQRNLDLLAPKVDSIFNFNSGANYHWPRFRFEKLADPVQTNVDLSKRDKLALWYVSNCNTPSQREVYARDLIWNLPRGSVSQFGSCNGRVCPRDSICEQSNDERHKFYIAFENSLCDGYITEKIVRAYEKGMVPVALGGRSKADYEALGLPPHSFIHVSDFASPRELAAYLVELDRNDAKFRAYHVWRGRYTLVAGVDAARRPELCALCKDLHADALRKSTWEDITAFWEHSCSQPSWGSAVLTEVPANATAAARPALRSSVPLALPAAPRRTPSWYWTVALLAAAVLAVPLWYYAFHERGAVLGEVGTAGGLSEKVAWGLMWYVCTVVMNVANKHAVGTSPTALAAVQMAFSCTVLLLCWPALRIASIKDLQELLPWAVVCVFFAGLLVSSLVSFQHESLSTIVLMASLRPLYAHVIEWGCFAERPSGKQLVGCSLLVLGSAAYLLSGVRGSVNSVTAIGVAALAFNGVVSAVDRCYQRYYLFHAPLAASPTALVLTMNFGALVLVLAAYPLWAEEVKPLATRVEAWAAGQGLADLTWVLLSCLGGVAIGFAGIGFQRVVSASEFLVIALGSRAVTFIVLDQYYFGANVSASAAGGLAIVVYGTWVHSTAKWEEAVGEKTTPSGVPPTSRGAAPR